MRKSDILIMPEYYDQYIVLVDDIELSEAFDESLKELDAVDLRAMNEMGLRTYAPGKWTVKEIMLHLSDVERILSYRSLLMIRNDSTQTAGFDQDFLVSNSKANDRNLKDIITELKAVRTSTALLFDGLDNEQLQRKGSCWKYEISVLAMGFSIIGHQIHHLNIIKERYLPLLEKSSI